VCEKNGENLILPRLWRVATII